MGLSRTVSEINGDFSRKSQISHPMYFAPIGVRAGGLGGGAAAPTFGQFDFFGDNDENLGGRPGKGFLEKKNIFFR